MNSLYRYKNLLFTLTIISFLIGCEEEDTVTAEEQQMQEDIIIKDFLEQNNINEADYERTNSGLYHIPLTVGDGESPALADSVLVEYTGKFLNGKKFDSSRNSENPFTFIIGTGQVIQGWEEALQLMKPGGTSRFIIPSVLGYGTSGRQNIPGNTILDFEIELISFEESSLSSSGN